MNSQFSSSNPFRRKPVAVPQAPDINAPISSNSIQPRTTDLSRLTTKPIKKVRLQSPPPHSPEQTSTAQRPPSPIPISTVNDDIRDDPFERAEVDVADQVSEPKGISSVPPNPFAKTLESLEPAKGVSPSISPEMQSTNSIGRASLDVEAFQRLLMTGNSGRTTTTSGTPLQPGHHSLMFDGTSTDTSSVSRQSIFESIQESHPESPRTSHELSEHEIERYSSVKDHSTGRKKPAPPSSRHGKLIKLELRDDPAQITEPSRPNSSSSKLSQQYIYQSSSPLNLSQTDLNKPLPAAPRRLSNDLNQEDEHESIFDKEAAGKIPEPPSPTSSISRKAPPPPPISRRHSHMASKSRNRIDTGRLSPKVEEELSSPLSPALRRERSSSNSSIAPTPPPSRRPTSLRSPSIVPPIPSPSAASVDSLVMTPKIAPAPPPSRSLSTRKPNRPASVISIESQKEPNKRSAPPPPPPRHKSSGHNSIDIPVLSPAVLSRGESFRRSFESSRRTSAALDRSESIEPKDITPSGPDILADLSALQREVEAAMAQQKKVS